MVSLHIASPSHNHVAIIPVVPNYVACTAKTTNKTFALSETKLTKLLATFDAREGARFFDCGHLLFFGAGFR